MGRLNRWIDALKDRCDAFFDGMRADPLRILDFDVDLSDSFAGLDAHVAGEPKTGSR